MTSLILRYKCGQITYSYLNIFFCCNFVNRKWIENREVYSEGTSASSANSTLVSQLDVSVFVNNNHSFYFFL